MGYDFLRGKTVLITGGTGSFGKRFTKMLLSTTDAKKVIVFSRDELKQSQMQVDLMEFKPRLRFFLGDVRDQERLKMAFSGVDYVVHAAALKQVPTLEYNPFEAVKTNIVGTQNVIMVAIERKVDKVLLISTDKAAYPANLYGATKLCAERLMVSSNAYSAHSGTSMSVVRYGNVLGSRGSIVEVAQQYMSTGEIPLTHEDMTRFWITLDQGVSIVLTALEKMCGGEIYIPKIPSMKVKDVIQALAPNCKIKLVGIRPGEKLHEVLITPEEARRTKEFDSYYVILPEHDWWSHKDSYKDVKDFLEFPFFDSDVNSTKFTEEEIKNIITDL